jgi:hypothetical protein
MRVVFHMLDQIPAGLIQTGGNIRTLYSETHRLIYSI